MPHVDGYFVGGINYYLYHHPTRGFMVFPWDVDYSFEVIGGTATDPVDYTVDWGHGKSQQFQAVIDNEDGYARYIEALKKALAAYDYRKTQPLIDEWSSQIADSMTEDTRKPFTTEHHKEAVAALREFVKERTEFVQEWLDNL